MPTPTPSIHHLAAARAATVSFHPPRSIAAAATATAVSRSARLPAWRRRRRRRRFGAFEVGFGGLRGRPGSVPGLFGPTTLAWRRRRRRKSHDFCMASASASAVHRATARLGTRPASPLSSPPSPPPSPPSLLFPCCRPRAARSAGRFFWRRRRSRYGVGWPCVASASGSVLYMASASASARDLAQRAVAVPHSRIHPWSCCATRESHSASMPH